MAEERMDGAFRDETEALSPEAMEAQVEWDLAEAEQTFADYGHDADQMARLFEKLLFSYGDQIDGFAEDLRVVQPYEDLFHRTEDYRYNVRLLLDRLRTFLLNGCTNEGLAEFHMALEHREINRMADFTEVRLTIGMMEGLSQNEREEIMEKLSQMDEICAMVLPKQKKWELLRGYLVWLSGKSADVALTILPLFFKIS